LKRLNFHYFCGLFDEDTGDFLVSLTKYLLDKLTIDVTPKAHLLVHHPHGYRHQWTFIIGVDCLEDSTRRLFKIPFPFGPVISITDSDMKGFIRGYHYYRVYITVKSLRCLDLLLGHGYFPEFDEFDLSYLDEGSSGHKNVERLNIFDDNINK
jgi:hypothetical protein